MNAEEHQTKLAIPRVFVNTSKCNKLTNVGFWEMLSPKNRCILLTDRSTCPCVGVFWSGQALVWPGPGCPCSSTLRHRSLNQIQHDLETFSSSLSLGRVFVFLGLQVVAVLWLQMLLWAFCKNPHLPRGISWITVDEIDCRALFTVWSADEVLIVLGQRG